MITCINKFLIFCVTFLSLFYRFRFYFVTSSCLDLNVLEVPNLKTKLKSPEVFIMSSFVTFCPLSFCYLDKNHPIYFWGEHFNHETYPNKKANERRKPYLLMYQHCL